MALTPCNTITDEQAREVNPHGTAAFPIACYHDELHLAAVPWHWHEELEAAVVEEGVCRLSVGTQEVTLQAGEGFLVNSGVLHGCSCSLPGERCCLRSMVFDPALVGGQPGSVYWAEYLTPVLRHTGCRAVYLRPEAPWQRAAIAHLLSAWAACVEEPAGYPLEVRSRLSQVMALWSAHLPPVEEGPTPDTRSERRVKEMLSFIQAHYAEPLTTRQIAASAAVSESECLRCFRRLLHTTPVKYLTACRLEQAEALLRHTGLPIGDIAARCGFHDVGYFARLFREKNGCAPRVYREQSARSAE